MELKILQIKIQRFFGLRSENSKENIVKLNNFLYNVFKELINLMTTFLFLRASGQCSISST